MAYRWGRSGLYMCYNTWHNNCSGFLGVLRSMQWWQVSGVLLTERLHSACQRSSEVANVVFSCSSVTVASMCKLCSLVDCCLLVPARLVGAASNIQAAVETVPVYGCRIYPHGGDCYGRAWGQGLILGVIDIEKTFACKHASKVAVLHARRPLAR